jgi:hypothetical protein
MYEALQSCYEAQRHAWASRAGLNVTSSRASHRRNSSNSSSTSKTRRRPSTRTRSEKGDMGTEPSKNATVADSISFMIHWLLTGKRKTGAETQDPLPKYNQNLSKREGAVRDAANNAVVGTRIAWECFGVVEVRCGLCVCCCCFCVCVCVCLCVCVCVCVCVCTDDTVVGKAHSVRGS